MLYISFCHLTRRQLYWHRGEGKSLYNGDVLNTEHQAVKNPINIKLAEFLGQLPSNAVLDMTGKDSNKIYTFDAPGANLIINGDASNLSFSGTTYGFIIANGASPIKIGYTDLYKYSQLPQPIIINSETKDTGLFSNGILDFRDVNITGNEQNNYILHSESVAIMYFKDKNQSNLLKSKLSTDKWADIEYYTGNPNIKTLQHFEAIGNDKLKNPPSNSVSKVIFTKSEIFGLKEKKQ